MPEQDPEQDKSSSFSDWCEDYRVDVQRMDKQHQSLFAALHALHDVLTSHGDAALIDKYLSDLIRQTRIHFHTEEEFMQAHDYPDYEHHKEIHDLLISQVEDLLAAQQSLESSSFQQSWVEKMEIADFLHAWLVEHIVNEDKKLGAFLSEQGVK